MPPLGASSPNEGRSKDSVCGRAGTTKVCCNPVSRLVPPSWSWATPLLAITGPLVVQPSRPAAKVPLLSGVAGILVSVGQQSDAGAAANDDVIAAVVVQVAGRQVGDDPQARHGQVGPGLEKTTGQTLEESHRAVALADGQVRQRVAHEVAYEDGHRLAAAAGVEGPGPVKVPSPLLW